MVFQAEIIYQKLGLVPLARGLAMNDAEIPASVAVFVHNMIMSICDLDNRRKIRKSINVPFNFGTSSLQATCFFITFKFRSTGA